MLDQKTLECTSCHGVVQLLHALGMTRRSPNEINYLHPKLFIYYIWSASTHT
jgi:hypothetical protein